MVIIRFLAIIFFFIGSLVFCAQIQNDDLKNLAGMIFLSAFLLYLYLSEILDCLQAIYEAIKGEEEEES